MRRSNLLLTSSSSILTFPRSTLLTGWRRWESRLAPSLLSSPLLLSSCTESSGQIRKIYSRSPSSENWRKSMADQRARFYLTGVCAEDTLSYPSHQAKHAKLRTLKATNLNSRRKMSKNWRLWTAETDGAILWASRTWDTSLTSAELLIMN